MGNLKYLLDTHTLLWAIREPKKLGKFAKDILSDADNPIFVSAVSAYEFMYKHQLGKMQGFEDIANDYFNAVKQLSTNELPISAEHAHYAGNVNWSHRDPFDRLLAAQAHLENMTLLTNDPDIKLLSWVTTLW
jgi:PIN domain nuclease of toxin-antitoxin system